MEQEMGCDIHLFRESRVNGEWKALDKWVDGEVDWESRFTDRNYDLFAILAGVRVRETPPYKFEPRGFPLGLCSDIAAHARSWDGDGHSHSYLYLHELSELREFLATQTQRISGMKDGAELDALNASIASGAPNWELLYPYCQSTNAKGAREFEIDVPANFIVGDGLDRIIASLDGCEGDLQRIVFWFDN